MFRQSLIAFTAGVITFVSPCVLPLLPAYIFYITGIKVDEKNEETFRYLAKVILFILGFTLIFVILGILTALLAFSIKNIRTYLNVIFGLLIIFFSLHYLGVIKLLFLNTDKRFNFTNLNTGFISPFLMGMGFAAGWSPCIGPVLGTILSLVATGDSLLKGVSLLLIYSVGLGVPFLLSAMFFNYLSPVVNFLKKYAEIIKIISGVFLLLIGILILLGTLNSLNIYLNKFSYFLQDSQPVSNYLFSLLIFLIGTLFTIRMILKKKVSIGYLISAIFFITLAVLNYLQIIPLLNWLINYLIYQGA